MTLFFFLFLFVSAFAADVDLLISFKNSLQNPSSLSNWSPTESPCSFPGVGCKGGHVASLTLQDPSLSPNFKSVSDFLLSIPSLETLYLSSTNLTGDIQSVSKCSSQLTVLDLSVNNNLRGAVSDVATLVTSCNALQSLNLSSTSIGTYPLKKTALPTEILPLQSLDLSYNKIETTGDLQWILSTLGLLKRLDLSSNKITGQVTAFNNCTSLQYLDLSENNLAGAVPVSTFSNCISLTSLNLSVNHFTGAVPDLSACTSLKTLSLSYNNFSGQIPINDLAAMRQLKILELGFNNFNGSLPESISKLSSLELLDLSSNGFTGPIPDKLCSNGESSLKELYLQNNYFSGFIPDSISECTNLISLDLSLNLLTGSIPGSVGSLSKLKDLIMWQNNLNGNIPSSLSSLKYLENLILDYNGLTGTIPDSLSNCTGLNWISLASNRLNGSIPAWIGKLDGLSILKLSNNSFTGSIPSELGDCKSLVWLDLNSNSLTGSIPVSISKQSGKVAVGQLSGKRYVYLRNDESSLCHGKGSLLEFGGIRSEDLTRMPSKKLCNFTRMYMGNTQATFNNNGSMIFLDLSYNQLTGSIPKEMSIMFYLLILNLGHNLLSGLIPPEIGQLVHVAVLDLSNNLLEGPIPASFSAMSLSEINLSNNRLNGSIPELGSLATFPKYVYENNSGLCGFPLPSCDNSNGSNNDSSHQKSHRQASLAGSVALGLLFALFCIFGLVIIAIESKKRRIKKEESSNNNSNFYLDSRSNSATISNWKLSGTNAMSINLATFDKPLQKLTFGDLFEATNGFNNDSLIGSGGFGDVYKAQLKDSKTVAIKKLIHVSGQGDREFTAEMETIGKIKHRNLVPLLGYCKVGEERLLVYEYMKYGSLDDILHDKNKIIKLNWQTRKKIAVGAARGLAFLHHNCIPHIIHRDMKSSNVLLDENFEARVSDFGMARFMSVMDTHLSVSTLAGTPGYVPPEYYQSFRCTTKGDIYSYGVVLLELLTGREPTDSVDFGDDCNLVGWVKQHSKTKIMDVFDKCLVGGGETGIELELLEHLKIACACLDDRPSKRPTMLKVMAMFKEIQMGSEKDGLSEGFSEEMSSLKEGKEEN